MQYPINHTLKKGQRGLARHFTIHSDSVGDVFDYLVDDIVDDDAAYFYRTVAVSAMDIEFERIDINPCPISDGNPEPNYFAGTARCKPSTMVSSTGHVVKLKNPDGTVSY